MYKWKMYSQHFNTSPHLLELVTMRSSLTKRNDVNWPWKINSFPGWYQSNEREISELSNEINNISNGASNNIHFFQKRFNKKAVMFTTSYYPLDVGGLWSKKKHLRLDGSKMLKFPKVLFLWLNFGINITLRNE